MRDYDALPWESIQTSGPEHEPESAAAVANRETGDSSPWYVGTLYVASPSTADYARRLERERAARDAARRAEWEARQASTFAPLDETQAAVVAGERGDAVTAAVVEDLLDAAHALGRTRISARRAA